MSAIKFENIDFSYDSNEVLKDVSATVEPGSSTCLLGRNGAGKTTLLEILYGLVKPETGKIEILGVDPFKEPEALRQKVAFVSESCHFYPNMNPVELESFLKPLYQNWSSEIFSERLEQFKIEKDQKIKNFSKGSRHKLMLATALAIQPEVMILDEPLAGFDTLIREEVINTIISTLCDKKTTILISTHQIDEIANVCDKTLILHDNKILLSENSEAIEDQYKKLVIDLEEEINFSPTHELILSSKSYGSRLELIVKNYSDEISSQLLQGLKVKNVEVQRIGLKDIFVNLVK